MAFQPVSVNTGTDDEDGMLVFIEGRLVAVLVQLSGLHDDREGSWFLEAGFGRCSAVPVPVFSDLNQAQSWIESRLLS